MSMADLNGEILDPGQSFGAVAPYYDELMRAVPYEMWVSYYLLLLAHQDVHPRKILDVCCCTGSMCELLAKQGFDMTGIDLSAGMINAAKKKVARKKVPIHFEVGDAADFQLGEKFDAALSFFDSLNNILEPADLQSAFCSVAKHLGPGGSWIFDLNTAYAFDAELFDQENLGSKSKLRYLWRGDWNADTRIITVDMHFWHDGREFREVHSQRAYEEDEIREMLRIAGFGNLHVFHSYTLNPPRYKSDRLHYTAVKL